MIDIHCHILPGFDDGSANIAESLSMARMAVDSGITGIVATPHFRGEEASLSVLNRLVARYQRLEQALKRENIPLQLYPGAEILCLPETAGLAQKKLLPTLGDSDYLLVEFYFNESADYMDNILTDLAGCGYRPVIAHPERYGAVQEQPAVLEHWFRLGYVLQLNKGSVLGAFGPKPEETAHWALERGLAHIVASDAHSARRRTPDMHSLRRHLADLCPDAYVQVLLRENPRRIVRGLPMVPWD